MELNTLLEEKTDVAITEKERLLSDFIKREIELFKKTDMIEVVRRYRNLDCYWGRFFYIPHTNQSSEE
jgi:hypothetical protein